MASIKFVLLAALLVLGCAFVRTQDTDAEQSTTSTTTTTATTASSSNFTSPSIVGPSPYIQTAVVFPDHLNKQLPAGEIIDVLLGLTNTYAPQSEEDTAVGPVFNVSMIFASLNHPSDFRYYIQNYSRFDYGILLSPGEQATFNYRFRPDPLLEPRDFGLLVHVVYEDVAKNLTHFHTFVNNTVEITEPYSAFDVQLVFTYTLLVAIVGLAGFAVYNKLAPGKIAKAGRRMRDAVEQGTRKTAVASDGNEWLIGTTADPMLKSRKERAKSTERSKSTTPTKSR